MSNGDIYTTYVTTYNQLQVTASYPSYADGTRHLGFDTKTPGNADRTARSPVDGLVIQAGKIIDWSYGNALLVYNAEQNFTYLAAHFEVLYVSENQTIKAGDPIGYYGETGNASGPHVHWEKHIGRGYTKNREFPDFVGVPNAVGIYNVEIGSPDVPEPPDPPEPVPLSINGIIASGLIPVLTQLQTAEQLKDMIDYNWLKIEYGGVIPD